MLIHNDKFLSADQQENSWSQKSGSSVQIPMTHWNSYKGKSVDPIRYLQNVKISLESAVKSQQFYRTFFNKKYSVKYHKKIIDDNVKFYIILK